MPSRPSKDLQRVPNAHPDRDYEVDHVVPEFTCVCPMTGQPDFATIRIRYVPDRWLVELKSLKLYMWAYRAEGAFHEDVTNRILNDLVRLLAPRRMEIVGDWNVRGGIKTVVTARYERAPARAAGSSTRTGSATRATRTRRRPAR
jgi:7-cyano-7-deazaguanine reductase